MKLLVANARVVLLGSLCAACRTSAPAPSPPEAVQPSPPSIARQEVAPTFATQTRAIFEEWFARHPVTATQLGEHRFDGRWPDVSATGIIADRQRIDMSLAALAAIDEAPLQVDERIDLAILRDALRLQRFTHTHEQPWLSDPMWYTQIAGDGLDDLVSRDFAPLEVRARSVVQRLQGLPRLLAQAQANLQPERTKRPQAEVALGQLDGLARLVEHVLPQRLAQAPASLRAALERATPPALEAIAAFRTHLSETLIPNAGGAWRLGAQTYAEKLPLMLQTELTPGEVRARAQTEHARVRAQMAALAAELGPHLIEAPRWRALLAGPDPQTASVRAVLDALAEHHVEPEQLRAHIELELQHLSDFVRRHDVVTLDEREVLEVIWTPPHARGVYIAGLAPPGPLEDHAQGLPSFYLVQPIPESWPPSRRTSFLREYNVFMLDVLSIHEAIPGHFVQLYHAKREPSYVRRALQNTPFVEGWAVYTEKVMTDLGYGGETPAHVPGDMNPRLRTVVTSPKLRQQAIALHRLKFYLRSVANAILDHDVHAGTMTREEALELLIERSFQEEGEAHGKWIRARVTSTQLSTYFVGYLAWMELREQAERRARDAGRPFDMRSFHDEALSHGAPPVHYLPALMGWEP